MGANEVIIDKAQVDNYMEYAEDEYTAGRLSQAAYCKVVMTLASEYLKDFGDLDSALVSINKLPVEYFDKTLAEQIEEDSLFAEVMLEFIYHLNRFGLIDGPEIKPTQGAANA